MDIEVKKALDNLRIALIEMQRHVIGVADIGGDIEPIIDYHEGSAISIKVGTLLGLAETHTSISGVNRLKIFGEDKTLDMLLENPAGLKDIITF